VKTPLIDQDGLLSVLYDLAAYTGATVVSRDMGMNPATIDPVSVVGKVSQLNVDKDRTTMIGGYGEINNRIDFLENFCRDNPILGDFDSDVLSERISKLKGGLMVV
jgi:chaperonin GroEL (HSP60 family)